MIFDGRWKWELKKQSWAISLWQKAPSYGEYGKHKLNRAVLYSATVLRKAIEDEIEAEKVAKEGSTEAQERTGQRFDGKYSVQGTGKEWDTVPGSRCSS